MQKIIPHLWFDGQAEDAARLYTPLIAGSRVGRVTRYGKAGFEQHGQREGTAMTAEFDLGGYRMVGLNAGPHFRFTPAVSYFVMLEAEADVDRLWAGLIEGGSVLMPLDAYDWSPKYGWLNDRYGLSWQIALGKLSDVGQTVTPALLFTGGQAGRAEEAINHYTSVFPDSHIKGMLRYDGSGPDPAGTIMHGQFSLCGQTFMAMDSALAHDFKFSEANSHLVLCKTQEEIDHFWSALSAVQEAERCGWLKDRFGVSWQVVPDVLIEMMTDPDPAKVGRVTEAFMAMTKLDVAKLKRAYAG